MLKSCVPVGLDWAKLMIFFLITCHMFMHFSCIHTNFLPSYWYQSVLVLFYLSLSHSLSFSFFQLVALWHLNVSLLCPRPLFILRHLLLILPPLMFNSTMKRPVRTFRRTFHDAAFIQNTKLSYRIFLILTFLLSSTIGVGSHFVASWSLVPLWSYRNFTPICTDLIILYLISSLTFGICAL